MIEMQRAQGSARCVTCHLHEALCICDLLPHLELATRLVVVMHRDEARKTTNTGRIAALSLVGSRVLMEGGGAEPPPEPDFAGARPLLLALGEGAEVLSPDHTASGPVALVVPDGTWKQARKMSKRIAWMGNLQRVVLPPGPPSLYGLRRTDKPGALSTMEAISRALGILEGGAVQDVLDRTFRILVARLLFSRGVISRAEALRAE